MEFLSDLREGFKMIEKIKEIDPNGMLLGISKEKECWKGTIEVKYLIEENDKKKTKN